MSLPMLLGIGLLGGAGAIGRFLLDGAVASQVGRSFPWGTLAVNISGAFALGALVGANLGADALRLAGTGVLGSFTTFSTWMLESHRLGSGVIPPVPGPSANQPASECTFAPSRGPKQP